MQETPYTAEELQRIHSHFETARAAMIDGTAMEALGKVGLPGAYAALAKSLYHGMIQQHGIGVPGEAIVMMGLTMGFALGRDFGQSEVIAQMSAEALQ